MRPPIRLTFSGLAAMSAIFCMGPAPATRPGPERPATPPAVASAAGVTFSAKVVGEKLESVVTADDRGRPVDVVLTWRFLPGPSGETSWEGRHLAGVAFTETTPFESLARRTKLEGATWRDQGWVLVTGYARPHDADQPYRTFDAQLVKLHPAASEPVGRAPGEGEAPPPTPAAGPPQSRPSALPWPPTPESFRPQVRGGRGTKLAARLVRQEGKLMLRYEASGWQVTGHELYRGQYRQFSLETLYYFGQGRFLGMRQAFGEVGNVLFAARTEMLRPVPDGTDQIAVQFQTVVCDGRGISDAQWGVWHTPTLWHFSSDVFGPDGIHERVATQPLDGDLVGWVAAADIPHEDGVSLTAVLDYLSPMAGTPTSRPDGPGGKSGEARKAAR